MFDEKLAPKLKSVQDIEDHYHRMLRAETGKYPLLLERRIKNRIEAKGVQEEQANEEVAHIGSLSME